MSFASAQSQIASFGERIVEGEASTSKIWLRNSDGAVIEVNRADGAERILTREGVIALEHVGTQLLALNETSAGATSYGIVDLLSGSTVGPTLDLRAPLALLASEESIVVLDSDAIYVLEAGAWRRQPLSAELRSAPQVSVAATSSGKIYVGYNFGEWGGGLQAIDAATGVVTEVRRIEGQLCGGMLNPACNPVTAVARDRSHADCVLAAIGLSHMMLNDGRVLRVCDDTVDVVFSKEIPIEPAPEGYVRVQLPGTWPLFDLVTTADGWAAVSQGRIFMASGPTVTSVRMPSLRAWHSIQMAELRSDLIVVRTDLNWSVSTSGYTPLLIEVSP